MAKDKISEAIGKKLAKYLNKTVSSYFPFSIHRHETLAGVMQPGDILLVEGNQRISSGIKYLTQSTWSHAAFYIGNYTHSKSPATPEPEPCNEQLIEADLENGVISVPLSKYTQFNIRICRPSQITNEDRITVCDFMIDSLGMKYDLKNIVDLARYLLPNPPVPARWRRRMLALGSGDPTRAVCSSLVAQAFQSIKYPILPDKLCNRPDGDLSREIMHIRHHSLFTPRDFDVSPYFEIVKPELVDDAFHYKKLNWYQHSDGFLETGKVEFDSDGPFCK